MIRLSIIILILSISINLATSQDKVKEVAVIAPSVSTSMKAREIRSEMGWTEVYPKKADFVLVVVRSALYNPLMPSYKCYCDLKQDADYQLNIAGPNFHIYLYQLYNDLHVNQIDHTSFPAD